VCGTVNAKNAFGGYVGAVPFIASFKRDGAMAAVIGAGSIPRRLTTAT
jgi:hypothetical protein